MHLVIKEKQFYKTMALIAMPIVLQNMITLGVNIMDTVMLGSYGEIQISASSLANNFIEIFHILNMGIGGGAGVLIAQYWGTGDTASIKKVIAIMFRICLLAVVIFSLAAAVFPAEIMSVYTKDAAVIEKGRIYLLVCLPAFFLQGMTLVMTLSLRAMQKVSVPFLASVISFFVNVFFNWVFIFGKLGAPELQIAGAALGTVIARVAETAIIGVYYFGRDRDLNLHIRDLFIPCSDQLSVFFVYGAPVILSDLLLTFGNNAVAVVMGHVGTAFVAAYSIVAPVMRLCNVLTAGLAQAAAVMTGNIVGTGDRVKAQRCGVTCFLLSIATGLVAGIVLLLICPAVITLYNVAGETKQIAEELMYAVVVMVVFQAIQSVLTKGVLRGGGDTRFVMIADVLFLWILSVPLGALCGLVWMVSPFWVYCALKIDYIVKSFWCAGKLFGGKWIKQIN